MQRGTFSAKNGILKGKGLDLGAEPPRIIIFLVPPGSLISFFLGKNINQSINK